MKTINLSDITLERVNKNSVTISFKGETIFITKRIFNNLLSLKSLEGDFVIKDYVNRNGSVSQMKWFGQISIF